MATVVITGANRGIGLELARQYTQRGDNVVALCRKPSDDLVKVGVEVIEGFDVTALDRRQKQGLKAVGIPDPK